VCTELDFFPNPRPFAMLGLSSYPQEIALAKSWANSARFKLETLAPAEDG
jgi:hypothetical protein